MDNSPFHKFRLDYEKKLDYSDDKEKCMLNLLNQSKIKVGLPKVDIIYIKSCIQKRKRILFKVMNTEIWKFFNSFENEIKMSYPKCLPPTIYSPISSRSYASLVSIWKSALHIFIEIMTRQS